MNIEEFKKWSRSISNSIKSTKNCKKNKYVEVIFINLNSKNLSHSLNFMSSMGNSFICSHLGHLTFVHVYPANILKPQFQHITFLYLYYIII